MPPVISDDMVLDWLPPRSLICLDVYMLDEIAIDVTAVIQVAIDAHWQRCDD